MIRAGSPIRTSFNVIVTRGKIVAPMLPTRTGCPSALASCDSTAVRTVSLARIAWAQKYSAAGHDNQQQRDADQDLFHDLWVIGRVPGNLCCAVAVQWVIVSVTETMKYE